jgi:hypothetical protein
MALVVISFFCADNSVNLGDTDFLDTGFRTRIRIRHGLTLIDADTRLRGHKFCFGQFGVLGESILDANLFN